MDNYYDEGFAAFGDLVGADQCPYSFSNSPYWDAKDYRGFEENNKRKLDEWMRGWLDAQAKSKASKKTRSHT